MQKIYVGVDVGSTSAKVAVVNDSNKILFQKYLRTLSRPVETVSLMLDEIAKLGMETERVVITGSGSKLLKNSEIFKKCAVTEQNEFKTITKAVSHLYKDVYTIFEMGGESSKFIKLDGETIVEYGTNGDCAAGTGSFIDQQANRLHYEVEDIGEIVSTAEKCARVAGRCSVFAKSDMIHAQQKGYKPPEVLKGLCLAVARNFKASIVKGRHIQPKVLFVGGLALNSGVANAIRETFDLKTEDLVVPKSAELISAIGAALIAKDYKSEIASKNVITFQETNIPLPPLSTKNVRFLRDQIRPSRSKAGEKLDAYIGIDIGSVSTNFAVVDKSGEMIMEIYTYTKARPIEVVTAGLKEIENDIGDKINIKGVGTTGSGRELIGELIGADVIKDEITAHKTGALHIAKEFLNEPVDTIFEIGGQDAKFISIENGIVTDFTMNEACAAGTGSFLEEQAEKLGIKIKQEFAKLALSSISPTQLGERCTVFMERDVNAHQLKGIRKEDIVAGLAYSVATNYLNRVVRGRKIGKHIFFQGGTAYNDAVAAAFSQILGKTITVPPHNGVIGAIGAALLAQNLPTETKFRGYDVGQVNYSIREFACNACTNSCDIQEFNVEGEKTYWGDKCSSKFRKKAHTDNKPVIEDLFQERERLLIDSTSVRSCERTRGRIGIPRGMFYYDKFPFWNAYFSTLGYNVVVSDPTNKQISHDSCELSVAEPCYPIKLIHGHVKNLVEQGIDQIFIPNVISSEKGPTDKIPYLCPWHQTLPFIIKSVTAFEKVKFLTPTIQFEFGESFVERCLSKMCKEIGVSNSLSRSALSAAYKAQANFNYQLKKAGSAALKTLEANGAEGIVLLGRPYNIYDMGANLNTPKKLREFYGMNVIPFDFLPVDDVDIESAAGNMFWSYGRKIIAATKIIANSKNLHAIYITNFKCGPDSFVKHFTSWSADKPYLTLQFDEHANDAGTVTRIEAYLDSKGLLKNNLNSKLCKNCKTERYLSQSSIMAEQEF